LLENQRRPGFAQPFHMATRKRGAEELYDIQADPHTIVNLVDRPGYAGTRRQLASQLRDWMRQTNDPRAIEPRTDYWDNAEYFGPG